MGEMVKAKKKTFQIRPFRCWQYGITWWATDEKGRKLSHSAFHRRNRKQWREGQELTDRAYNVKSNDKKVKVSGVLRYGKDGFVWLQLFDKKGKMAVQCSRLPVEKVRWEFALYPIYGEHEKEWKIWKMKE